MLAGLVHIWTTGLKLVQQWKSFLSFSAHANFLLCGGVLHFLRWVDVAAQPFVTLLRAEFNVCEVCVFNTRRKWWGFFVFFRQPMDFRVSLFQHNLKFQPPSFPSRHSRAFASAFSAERFCIPRYTSFICVLFWMNEVKALKQSQVL